MASNYKRGFFVQEDFWLAVRGCSRKVQGEVMGALALGRVSYDRWVKYVWKLIVLFVLLTMAFLAVGALLGM